MSPVDSDFSTGTEVSSFAFNSKFFVAFINALSAFRAAFFAAFFSNLPSSSLTSTSRPLLMSLSVPFFCSIPSISRPLSRFFNRLNSFRSSFARRAISSPLATDGFSFPFSILRFLIFVLLLVFFPVERAPTASSSYGRFGILFGRYEVLHIFKMKWGVFVEVHDISPMSPTSPIRNAL